MGLGQVSPSRGIHVAIFVMLPCIRSFIDHRLEQFQNISGNDTEFFLPEALPDLFLFLSISSIFFRMVENGSGIFF